MGVMKRVLFLTTLILLVVVAALPRDVAHHGVQDHVGNLYVPVDPSFALDATVTVND